MHASCMSLPRTSGLPTPGAATACPAEPTAPSRRPARCPCTLPHETCCCSSNQVGLASMRSLFFFSPTQEGGQDALVTQPESAEPQLSPHIPSSCPKFFPFLNCALPAARAAAAWLGASAWSPGTGCNLTGIFLILVRYLDS